MIFRRDFGNNDARSSFRRHSEWVDAWKARRRLAIMMNKATGYTEAPAA